MATFVNRSVGRDSSGRIQYSGRERIGFRARSGGGYERVAGGEISTERGSLSRNRVNQENQAAAAAQEQAAATRTESTAVASTVGADGRPSVIRQQTFIGGFSTPVNGQAGYGTASYTRNDVVGVSGTRAPQSRTITGTVQPRSSLPFIQRQEAAIDERTQMSRQSNNPFTRARGIDQAFAGGLIISGARTAQTAKAVVTQPKQVATSVFGAGVRFFANPIATTSQGISNIGASAARNPARFGGVVAGDILTGRAIDKGFTSASRSIRFAGKTEVPAESIVAKSYLSGDEFFPTGTPASSVRTINVNQRAFSASPVAPNKGKTFTVLTQAEKKKAGLDLSETGGLYAAPKVSPAFTQLVVRGESRPQFTLVPSFGVPGSIASIETRASRLPFSVRSQIKSTNSLTPGNRFIDGGIQSRGTRKAFSTPASELGKTEAEVLFPGGSVIERKGNYGFLSRATGRDFDEFVRVPVSPGSTKTVPVALREYRNLGLKASDDYISRTGVFPKNRKISRVSDIEYYRASKPASSWCASASKTSSWANSTASTSAWTSARPCTCR
jgi:hypothetical protein